MVNSEKTQLISKIVKICNPKNDELCFGRNGLACVMYSSAMKKIMNRAKQSVEIPCIAVGVVQKLRGQDEVGR